MKNGTADNQAVSDCYRYNRYNRYNRYKRDNIIKTTRLRRVIKNSGEFFSEEDEKSFLKKNNHNEVTPATGNPRRRKGQRSGAAAPTPERKGSAGACRQPRVCGASICRAVAFSSIHIAAPPPDNPDSIAVRGIMANHKVMLREMRFKRRKPSPDYDANPLERERLREIRFKRRKPSKTISYTPERVNVDCGACKCPFWRCRVHGLVSASSGSAVMPPNSAANSITRIASGILPCNPSHPCC